MQSGEWWIDDGGQLTFADGDVGDTNHEAEAFWSALEIDREDPDMPADLIPGERFTPEIIAYLKEMGSPQKAIDYFKKGADARDYAIEHMGWIRVKGKNAEVWELTDESLSNLQRADFWEEEDEDSDEELFLEELKTGKTWSVPFKVLSKAQSAEGLKRYMEGVGQWHRRDFDGHKKRSRRRR